MTSATDSPTGGQADDFSHNSTRAILDAACHYAGFSPTGAALIRLGENALYRLTDDPVVVRIARTMDYWHQVQKEVLVSEWLADEEYPAARVVEPPEQPVEINGHPVTFWRLINGRDGEPGDVAALAQLLHRFHRLSKPRRFNLPANKLDDRIARRLKVAPVSEGDKSYLLGKLQELSGEADKLSYPLPPSPIHGDAHIKNLMVVEDTPIMIDFEYTGWGHPEWDLMMTATEYVTAKFWSDSQYATFVESYGFDVTAWAGFDTLRQIQEIKMTTWLMQNINQSRDIADEFSVRMDAIRTGRSDRPWKPY